MRVANWETGSAMPSLRKNATPYQMRQRAGVPPRPRTLRRRRASGAELGREILEINGRDVDRRLGSGFSDARPVLVWPCDMRRAQPAFRRRQKIVGMRGDQHALGWRQVEGLAGGEIDARLGLVVAGDFRAQNRIPGKIVAASEIDHQRDVAVRERREPETPLKSGEPSPHVGPSRKAMPSEIKIARRVLGELGNPEPRQNAIEIFPMQHVELAVCPAAGPHLFEGGLVLLAPSVGEGAPIELVAGGPEDALPLARHAGAKVDQPAEPAQA